MKATYTLNTPIILQMMIIVLIFLLQNGLLSIPSQLVFLTFGARDLHSVIQDMFSFIPFKIILDWYHLQKIGRFEPREILPAHGQQSGYIQLVEDYGLTRSSKLVCRHNSITVTALKSQWRHNSTLLSIVHSATRISF
jgi:hypothetical protein